jgi:hypothetical protein
MPTVTTIGQPAQQYTHKGQAAKKTTITAIKGKKIEPTSQDTTNHVRLRT